MVPDLEGWDWELEATMEEGGWRRKGFGEGHAARVEQVGSEQVKRLLSFFFSLPPTTRKQIVPRAPPIWPKILRAPVPRVWEAQLTVGRHYFPTNRWMVIRLVTMQSNIN